MENVVGTAPAVKKRKSLLGIIPSGIWCLLIVCVLFGYLGYVMGAANLIKTIMSTAHDLLLNTCFYLMALCVITGALGKILVEFGVVKLLEKLLRPMMGPVFNLPGVASLGGVLTFLSDNPAIITLSHDKEFCSYFKKYQYISLTNFGTAFGMGLLVMVFMIGQGFFVAPLVGLFGACCGCVVSTRFMQYFIIKDYPHFKHEDVEGAVKPTEKKEEEGPKQGAFIRILNSVLDGGKEGVTVGLQIIPGVLIISSLVMLLTFDGGAGYDGSAYQGTALLPWLAGKINFVFEWLFGFNDPHLLAFPITALGAVGAALSLVPNFMSQGWIDANAIAVFTAIGMCWSGFLSTHTAMLDSMGFRQLTSRAIISHTIGGIVAAIVAHLIYLGIAFAFGL